MVASSRHVVAAANSSKLGHTAHAYVGPSTVVPLSSPTNPPADEVAALEGTGSVVKTA